MKQRLGLEGCQCRTYTAVQNHISATMLAHFSLEILAATQLFGVYDKSMELMNIFHGINDKFPGLDERRRFLEACGF
mgnify:CR=1 FL=1